jgi:hypothetical protein
MTLQSTTRSSFRASSRPAHRHRRAWPDTPAARTTRQPLQARTCRAVSSTAVDQTRHHASEFLRVLAVARRPPRSSAIRFPPVRGGKSRWSRYGAAVSRNAREQWTSRRRRHREPLPFQICHETARRALARVRDSRHFASRQRAHHKQIFDHVRCLGTERERGTSNPRRIPLDLPWRVRCWNLARHAEPHPIDSKSILFGVAELARVQETSSKVSGFFRSSVPI